MNVRFSCLARNWTEVRPAVPTFLQYSPRLTGMAQMIRGAQVVLGAEPEATAVQLLDAGANRVLLGDAALHDAGVVVRLAQRFGAARIGVHVPVRRQAVSWSLETESNEDFNVVTPSFCEPVWEVLLANGETSPHRAVAWVDAMLGLGIRSFLLRVDIADDADLNLCAGMVETLGTKLWLAPHNDPNPSLADWVNYGQVRQLALPASLYHRRHQLLPHGHDAAAVTTTA